MTVRQGRCLCGAVSFEVAGDLPPPDACHCSICRRQSGHYWASTDVPRSAVTIKGEENVTWYRSSEKVRRGFCATCGSTLTYEGERWPGEVHVHIGAFDRPETLVPIHEGNTAERLPWLHLDTGMLPRGSDATRADNV
jgi:hypothetical protein